MALFYGKWRCSYRLLEYILINMMSAIKYCMDVQNIFFLLKEIIKSFFDVTQ